MRVLNVGGTGFIGARVTATLAERGVDVVCFDLATERSMGNEVTVVEGDVTDREAVRDAIATYEPDRVVHLAYMMTATCEEHPNRAVEVNCLGTDNVLQAAGEAGVDRIAYASSVAVYGWPDAYDATVTEDVDPVAAYSQYPRMMLYGATKQLNEFQARRYAYQFDLDAVAIRPSIVFGPGRTAGLHTWSSSFVPDAAAGGTAEIPYAPDQPLGMVYYDDVAELFAAILTAEEVPHESYNTGGHALSAQALAETVEEAVGGTVECDPSARRLGLVADPSYERARRDFGYELTPLEEAIEEHAARVA